MVPLPIKDPNGVMGVQIVGVKWSMSEEGTDWFPSNAEQRILLGIPI